MSPATENCASDGVVVPTPTRPFDVTMRAVLVAVGVEVEMRKRMLVESGCPAIASLAKGEVVPIPTLPLCDSTTNLSVCTARPPANVDVAVVLVAVKCVAFDSPYVVKAPAAESVPPTDTSEEKLPLVPEKEEEPLIARLVAVPFVMAGEEKVPVVTVGFARVTFDNISMLKAGAETLL